MAIFEAESYDKIVEVLTHPEFRRTVEPDEKNFFDRSKSLVFAGTVNTFWNTDLVSPCSRCIGRLLMLPLLGLRWFGIGISSMVWSVVSFKISHRVLCDLYQQPNSPRVFHHIISVRSDSQIKAASFGRH